MPIVRSRMVPLVVAALACSTEPVESPPPPPPVGQLRIDPAEPVLTAGTALHFTAFLPSGLEAAVSWSLDDANAGSITANGDFTHNFCFSGPVRVRARLLSDPTVSAANRIQIAYNASAFVWLSSILQNNGQAVPVDSLTGTVRFLVGLDAMPYRCRSVRMLRLMRLVNLDVVTVDSLVFDPPLETSAQEVLSWQTTLAGNGLYGLVLVATRGDGSVETRSFTVNVRNP
jgi:hypothetical protein